MMFQLSEDEVDFTVLQKAIPSKKHLGGCLSHVFKEQELERVTGYMLSLDDNQKA